MHFRRSCKDYPLIILLIYDRGRTTIKQDSTKSPNASNSINCISTEQKTLGLGRGFSVLKTIIIVKVKRDNDAKFMVALCRDYTAP